MTYVIDRITKQIKRWGYVDFASEFIFDAINEEVITDGIHLDPHTVWYWNSTTQEFQPTPP